MWPVLTLTLLLQLTDDEQLYARQEQPVVKADDKQEQPPAIKPDVEKPAAAWPDEGPANG